MNSNLDQNNKVNGNKHQSNIANPMRLSSDSGFTSQDTLFLRPASPKRLHKNVDVASERPHTISTAYEKGHQRPQLQPYTFSPPESTLTIHECEQDEVFEPIQPIMDNNVNFLVVAASRSE